MSTSRTDPAYSRAGSISSPGLCVPKVTVRSARTAAPLTWPVSASTPPGRATAATAGPGRPAGGGGGAGGGPGPLGDLGQPGRVGAEPALAADPDDAVEDEVGPFD